MKPISLYIHWPYCSRICPYCDFNIYKNKPDNQDALVAAILVDMRHWREWSGPRQLGSIHFGGGTPSLINAENLEAIINLAKNLWMPTNQTEIGLEANPNDISLESVVAWKTAGIERLSIGVQSFDTQVLKFLGRDHDGAQSLSALEIAVEQNLRVSADLIYGWAGQSLTAWQADLETAVRAGVSHISAYQLTIENRTAFASAQRRGQYKAVGEDQSADLYERGLDILSRASFEQYEVSNYAKSQDAQSRHNLCYWTGGDYVGVGPGAHGRLTLGGVRTATICARKPQAYTEHVQEFGHGMSSQDNLSPQDWGQEYLLMGMRVPKGILLARFSEISGQVLSIASIKNYVDMNLLRRTDDHISATPSGRLVLDHICHELLLSMES